MQYLKITYRFLRFLPAAILVFGMSSCLKSTAVPTNDGSVTSVLEFGDISYPESFGTDPLAYDNNGLAVTNDTTSINIMVDYAGPVFNVPTDITLQLAYDTIAVSTYNGEQGVAYAQVPAAAISFPTSVTIPAGQHLAYVHVVINEGLGAPPLNDSTNYAFGMLITSVSSGVLSGNHADAVYEFSLGN
jgi:hypothetical protein